MGVRPDSEPAFPILKRIMTIFTRVIFKTFFFNVYLFLRQRETEHERGRLREGDTECEASSRLRAVSTEPDTGLELTDREIMT